MHLHFDLASSFRHFEMGCCRRFHVSQLSSLKKFTFIHFINFLAQLHILKFLIVVPPSKIIIENFSSFTSSYKNPPHMSLWGKMFQNTFEIDVLLIILENRVSLQTALRGTMEIVVPMKQKHRGITKTFQVSSDLKMSYLLSEIVL